MPHFEKILQPPDGFSRFVDLIQTKYLETWRPSPVTDENIWAEHLKLATNAPNKVFFRDFVWLNIIKIIKFLKSHFFKNENLKNPTLPYPARAYLADGIGRCENKDNHLSSR